MAKSDSHIMTPKVYQSPPFHYTTYHNWLDEDGRHQMQPVVNCSDPDRCDLCATISPRSDKA